MKLNRIYHDDQRNGDGGRQGGSDTHGFDNKNNNIHTVRRVVQEEFNREPKGMHHGQKQQQPQLIQSLRAAKKN